MTNSPMTDDMLTVPVKGDYDTLISRLSDVQQKLITVNRDVRQDINRLRTTRNDLRGMRGILRRLRTGLILFGRLILLSVLVLSAAAVSAGNLSPVVLKHATDLPVLTCQPLDLCAVQLQPGEVLTETPTLGDGVHWSAEVRAAGGEGHQLLRVILKPDGAATQTSLMIATNRGFYDVRLIASETDHMPVITLPDAALSAITQGGSPAPKDAPRARIGSQTCECPG